MSNGLMKLDLQHFAEPAGGTEPPVAQGTQPTQSAPTQPTQQGQQGQPPSIDYDKLIQIVQGKQSAAEESALKGYLKQQGLSKEQMDQAIATYKQQQAASQPNVAEIQATNERYAAQLKETQVINKTMLLAGELGIDVKTVPYVAKLADMSGVFGEDGSIAEEKLKESINKVLSDVPGFKTTHPGQGEGTDTKAGFQQIGGGGQQQNNNQEDLLKGIFGIKK